MRLRVVGEILTEMRPSISPESQSKSRGVRISLPAPCSISRQSRLTSSIFYSMAYVSVFLLLATKIQQNFLISKTQPKKGLKWTKCLQAVFLIFAGYPRHSDWTFLSRLVGLSLGAGASLSDQRSGITPGSITPINLYVFLIPQPRFNKIWNVAALRSSYPIFSIKIEGYPSFFSAQSLYYFLRWQECRRSYSSGGRLELFNQPRRG